jgi:hypothetical protein
MAAVRLPNSMAKLHSYHSYRVTYSNRRMWSFARLIQANRLAIAFSTALVRSRASSFNNNRET